MAETKGSEFRTYFACQGNRINQKLRPAQAMKTFVRHEINRDGWLQTRTGASAQGRSCSVENDENRTRHISAPDGSNVFHEQREADNGNIRPALRRDPMLEIKRKILQKLSRRLDHENCFRHLK